MLLYWSTDLLKCWFVGLFACWYVGRLVFGTLVLWSVGENIKPFAVSSCCYYNVTNIKRTGFSYFAKLVCPVKLRAWYKEVSVV